MLYTAVKKHAEAFFTRLGEEGASLPAFLYVEFERCLRYGRPQAGFVGVV